MKEINEKVLKYSEKTILQYLFIYFFHVFENEGLLSRVKIGYNHYDFMLQPVFRVF